MSVKKQRRAIEAVSFEKVQQLLQEESVPSWQQSRDEEVVSRSRVQPRTAGQRHYLEALERSAITICTGPAGTGKSYLPTSLGLQYLREKRVTRLVLTRPLVSCSGRAQGMGYLPGTVEEKTGPYMRPLLDILYSLAGRQEIDGYLHRNQIEVVPLDLMRGLTLAATFLVADEMQNASIEQHRMLLTRLGEGSRFSLSGDASQSDVPSGTTNPLLDCMQRMRGIGDIALVYLTQRDIVRHPLLRTIEERYTRPYHELWDGQSEWRQGRDIWFASECPICGAVSWANDGDVEDDRIHPVEFVRCWQCLSWLDVIEDTPLLVAHPQGGRQFQGLRRPGG